MCALLRYNQSKYRVNPLLTPTPGCRMTHVRRRPSTLARRRLFLARGAVLLGASLAPAACLAAVGIATSAPATIDTAPPALALDPLPANLLLHGGQAVTFHWTTADAHPGTTAADFTAEVRDGATPVEARTYLDTPAATDWTWTAPEMSSGYLRVVVACRDAFGNATTAQSDDFSVILSTSGAPDTALPLRPVLDGASPNPCNPRTMVRFRLPAAGDAELTVLAADGARVRRLASGRFAAGDHAVSWDGRDDAGRPVASGAYLLRLVAGGTRQVRKLALVR